MAKLSPRIPREHNKYHGYTVRGTPNCPLILVFQNFRHTWGLEMSKDPLKEWNLIWETLNTDPQKGMTGRLGSKVNFWEHLPLRDLFVLYIVFPFPYFS